MRCSEWPQPTYRLSSFAMVLYGNCMHADWALFIEAPCSQDFGLLLLR